MAVENNKLFNNDYFQGFKSHDEVDYVSRILEDYKFVKRGPIEINFEHKQPIGYALLINPSLKKVFAYQRSQKGGDKRLHNKWSWGIGGHIEKTEEERDNPIYASLLREIKEEVLINGEIENIRVLGYLNDDSDEVGKVHFGILYLVETDSTEIKPLDSEIEVGELKTIKELEEICASDECIVEGWSEIALEPLKRYLLK
ncbi:NUDIX domain-containing protein [Candidatus Woesearchaeota archaeon]|nr:NUDIX domain-containing protein [Candidatus Woesearchaeota archaeon]